MIINVRYVVLHPKIVNNVHMLKEISETIVNAVMGTMMMEIIIQCVFNVITNVKLAIVLLQIVRVVRIIQEIFKIIAYVMMDFMMIL